MPEFSMQEFVAIIRDSSFMNFMKLTNKPDYELDSSLSLYGNDGILYSTGDTTSDDGDYLSVHMTMERNVHFLSFSTSNKKQYQLLERQVGEMGFKRQDDDLKLKEYTLGKVYLTIGIVGEKRFPSYMFSLSRDDREDSLK